MFYRIRTLWTTTALAARLRLAATRLLSARHLLMRDLLTPAPFTCSISALANCRESFHCRTLMTLPALALPSQRSGTVSPWERLRMEMRESPASDRFIFMTTFPINNLYISPTRFFKTAAIARIHCGRTTTASASRSPLSETTCSPARLSIRISPPPILLIAPPAISFKLTQARIRALMIVLAFLSLSPARTCS